MSSSQVFVLPDLGEGLTEAEIVQWHVTEGDEVAIDQHVVTVETAKAAVDVPCPYAGRVASLHGTPGDVLAVGQPLITIEALSITEGGDGGGDPAEQYRTEGQAGAAPPAEDSGSGSGSVLIGYGTGGGDRRRRRVPRRPAPAYVPDGAHLDGQVTPTGERPDAVKVISPLVRRLAHDAGLDLAAIAPGSPDGVVRRADVVRASADPGRQASPPTSTASATPVAPSAAPVASSAAPVASSPALAAGDLRIPLTGLRRVVANKLSTSRREIPDATTWVDVDATELMAVRDTLSRLRPDDSIGVLALMARIGVAGLQRYPVLNASVDPEAAEIVQHGDIHLGVAAQSPRGLVVPVVRDAGSMSTGQLAAALRDLTGAAREGSLTPAQLTGGTFTLNNYGVFGVDGSTPIINHPEAAMLGVGRVIDRPWAHEGQVALRKVTQLSFTFDHRVCDGGTAGGFLRYVADCVEQPAVLLAGL